MSSEPPHGSGGQPPDDDPLKKRPPFPGPGGPGPEPGAGGGAETPHGTPPPFGAPPPQGTPPPFGTPPPYSGDPFGGGSAPTDPLAGMPPLAESGRRTLARIIDMILVGIVVWLLGWAFNVQEFQVDGNDVSVGKSFGQSVIAAVLYVGYDTYMIARDGQTLGKKWLGMRVANLDNGATPSVQTSLIRALVLWVPFAFCCACVWTIIAGGWSFFDKPYKQGLHDKAAKTVVVSTR